MEQYSFQLHSLVWERKKKATELVTEMKEDIEEVEEELEIGEKSGE